MSDFPLARCPYCAQGIPTKNGNFQEHRDRTGTWQCPMSGEPVGDAETEPT